MTGLLFPGWESDVSAAVGLTISEFRFAVSFFLSVFVSWIWRFVPTETGLEAMTTPLQHRETRSMQTLVSWSAVCAGRHLYAIGTGFCLIYYPFGNGCFHALVPSTLTYAVMRYLRPQAASLAWLINFSYLIGW